MEPVFTRANASIPVLTVPWDLPNVWLAKMDSLSKMEAVSNAVMAVSLATTKLCRAQSAQMVFILHQTAHALFAT